MGGTCFTPVWVGVHAGNFDLFDMDAATADFLEPFVEDGNVGPLMSAFSEMGVWDSSVGSAPLCPGDSANLTAVLQVELKPHYFSYSSMILPSNDAFVGNDMPGAYPIFDEMGEFVPVSFTVMGSSVLDAGTEVNDEAPATTAKFGQSVANTGTAENGVIGMHPGFNDPAMGGILADDLYTNADFTQDGYSVMTISVEATELEMKTVKIKAVNKAPEMGTVQTPLWVGIHDGSFTLFESGMPASPELERIAEDGNAGPMVATFARTPGTVWSGVIGDAPFGPGEEVELEIQVPVIPDKTHYMAYASMVLPSNDAFVGNAQPKAIIGEDGSIMASTTTVMGSQVWDAGTEVNDEVPENVPKLAQAMPDTGADEMGNVMLHPGFIEGGTILSNEMYTAADFTSDGYMMMTIEVIDPNDMMDPMDEEMTSYAATISVVAAGCMGALALFL